MVFNWFRKKAPVIIENGRYFSKFNYDMPLKDYPLVVVDTELTNLDSRKGEIISIGAVKIDNLQIDLGNVFHQYVQPIKLDPTEATLIHRITPEQLRDAPTLDKALPDFLDFLGKSLIVGHCIDIDLEFLNKACRRIFGGALSNPNIDTMKFARGYQRKLYGCYHDHGSIRGSYNLHDLSKKFHLPIFEQHNAFGDAMQTAYLFIFLMKKFRSGGLKTLKDVYEASRTGIWSGEI